jgi:hypothetical protein
MAKATGEISASDGGQQIVDVGRGGANKTYVYTHSKVDGEPLHMSIPKGWTLVAYYEHDLQLYQVAGQAMSAHIEYSIGDSNLKNNSYSSHSGAFVGYVNSGTNNNPSLLGTPVGTPEYDTPFVPRVSPVFVEMSASLSSNLPEIVAVDLDEGYRSDPSGPDYEVTCTDPGRWTPFSPNRAASAFSLKYLAHNMNKLMEETRSSQTVAI